MQLQPGPPHSCVRGIGILRAFLIYHDKEVAKWVKQLTVDFTNWFLEEYGVEHQIRLYLYAAGSLRNGKNGDMGAAFFDVTNGKPHIRVAVWWYFWRDAGAVRNREEARQEILDSLAHELVHYNKWRRGIGRNHRGLQQTVDKMIRRFNEHST